MLYPQSENLNAPFLDLMLMHTTEIGIGVYIGIGEKVGLK